MPLIPVFYLERSFVFQELAVEENGERREVRDEERESERETDRETDRHTDRQRQRERERERERDRGRRWRGEERESQSLTILFGYKF